MTQNEEIMLKRDRDGAEQEIDPLTGMREIRRYCNLDTTMISIALRGDNGLHTPEGAYFLKQVKVRPADTGMRR